MTMFIIKVTGVGIGVNGEVFNTFGSWKPLMWSKLGMTGHEPMVFDNFESAKFHMEAEERFFRFWGARENQDRFPEFRIDKFEYIN